MPRWKNSAPKQLYTIVFHDTGEVISYTNKQERDEDFVYENQTDTHVLVTKMTYVQKEK